LLDICLFHLHATSQACIYDRAHSLSSFYPPELLWERPLMVMEAPTIIALVRMMYPRINLPAGE
jgi:hypothetical protein